MLVSQTIRYDMLASGQGQTCLGSSAQTALSSTIIVHTLRCTSSLVKSTPHELIAQLGVLERVITRLLHEFGRT